MKTKAESTPVARLIIEVEYNSRIPDVADLTDIIEKCKELGEIKRATLEVLKNSTIDVSGY